MTLAPMVVDTVNHVIETGHESSTHPYLEDNLAKDRGKKPMVMEQVDLTMDRGAIGIKTMVKAGSAGDGLKFKAQQARRTQKAPKRNGPGREEAGDGSVIVFKRGMNRRKREFDESSSTEGNIGKKLKEGGVLGISLTGRDEILSKEIRAGKDWTGSIDGKTELEAKLRQEQ